MSNARVRVVPGLGLALALLAGAAAADQPFGMHVSAAELHFMTTLNAQGADLETGRDGPRDPARAAEAFRKAAVLGYPPSQHRLGLLYERGEGVPKDDVTALMWLIIAARSGDAQMVADRDRLSGDMDYAHRGLAHVLAKELERHLPDPLR